jgi:cyclic-di-GMP phosphodiesterase TipF (flagellum assembly factor)
VLTAPAADEDAYAADDPHWQTEPPPEQFESLLSLGAELPAAAPEGEMPRPPSQPGTWPEPLPMPAASREVASGPADPFTFRPSRGPHFEDGGSEPKAPAQSSGGEKGQAAPAMPPEFNVELIQDLIKKLADELNGPPAGEAEGETGPASASAPASDPASATAPEAMVGRSAAALDTAARAMRGTSAQAPAAGRKGPLPASWPLAPAGARAGAPPALDPKLARIAEAIAAERLEVLLEPIHTLAEGRPRHYEISMRLLAADGAAIEQRDYARAAAGSGLMPRIDAARMLRAARVARRLSERGRQGSVLAATAGESLADEAFLDAAALQPGTDGRIRLVLAFAQSDVRSFTPVHAEALGSMAAGGFGFALEDVTDLDMDFGQLKAMGFEFVKLDAEVFLEGLRAPGGRVPAADICRHLSEFGLTLIVGRIEDDWLLARVLGFGVLLGKGAFFGGPKLVKAEVVAEPGSAAAA